MYYLCMVKFNKAKNLSPGSALGFKSIPLSEEPFDNRRMGPGRLTIIFSSSVVPVAGDRDWS